MNWWQAVSTMPRLDIGQWQALALPVRWIIAVRGAVLFMTLMSAALGGFLAWRDGAGELAPWLVCVAGLCLAHATNNLLNDLTDSRRGIDAGNYYRNHYGVHTIEDGLLSNKQFYAYLTLTGAAAIAAGLWLVFYRGGLTLPLMLAGAFFVLFYTWPLKYWGLGEPAVLAVWGPLMVGGSYYVTSGAWSSEAAWLGLLYGLGPTAVLFGKHIDKLTLDRAKGVNTLPVILGDSAARRASQILIVSQYVGCVALVLTGTEHWVLLAVLVSVPQMLRAVKALQTPKPDTKPAHYPQKIWPLWFSAQAFSLTRSFTSWFIAALLVSFWL